jgi:hypothetical protein
MNHLPFCAWRRTERWNEFDWLTINLDSSSGLNLDPEGKEKPSLGDG